VVPSRVDDTVASPGTVALSLYGIRNLSPGHTQAGREEQSVRGSVAMNLGESRMVQAL
jgi:hypothetical protein